MARAVGLHELSNQNNTCWSLGQHDLSWLKASWWTLIEWKCSVGLTFDHNRKHYQYVTSKHITRDPWGWPTSNTMLFSHWHSDQNYTGSDLILVNLNEVDGRLALTGQNCSPGLDVERVHVHFHQLRSLSTNSWHMFELIHGITRWRSSTHNSHSSHENVHQCNEQ